MPLRSPPLPLPPTPPVDRIVELIEATQQRLGRLAAVRSPSYPSPLRPPVDRIVELIEATQQRRVQRLLRQHEAALHHWPDDGGVALGRRVVQAGAVEMVVLLPGVCPGRKENPGGQ